MSSQDLPEVSLPPHELPWSAPRGKSVSLFDVTTSKRQPKRVSICGIHDISPPIAQIVNCIPLYGYFFRSLGTLPSVANPMIGKNPHFSRASTVFSGTVGGSIQQCESVETVHHCLNPKHSNVASTVHAFPNFHSTLDSSFPGFRQLQKAEMALAHSHSATNDAVLALLRLGHSPSSVSKNMVNVTDQTPEMLPPSRTKFQADTIEAVKRPFPKKSDPSSAKTMYASLRPKVLSMPSDAGNVNGLHRFVRSELLELFEPSPATDNKKHRRSCVGLRCVYCARAIRKKRKVESTYSFFPKSLEDIYVGVCTWQRIHFAHCKNSPTTKSQKYLKLKQDKRRGKKAYWTHSAYELGLRNVSHKREGIMWCLETKDAEDSVSEA